MSAKVATPRITEADWQRTITDLADALGWWWAHFRPARTARGWRTPVSGPMGAGFPDLVLVRDRIVFVELKGPRGRLSDAQEGAIAALRLAGVEAYVWAPRDFDEACDVLRRRTANEGPAAPQRPGPGRTSTEEVTP